MTKYITAYDTTACRDYVLKKTIDAVDIAYGNGFLDMEGGILLVKGGAAVVDAIPSFAHPLFSSHINNLVADVRSFGKYDRAQNKFIVRNTIEYNLAVHRANLNKIWIEESASILRDISPLPISVFSSWISESLGKRFALDPREQLNVAILAAIFYNSLFADSNDLIFEERDKLRITTSVTKATRASAEDVLKILDQLSDVGQNGASVSIYDFCYHAEKISGSVRLRELNPGLLYSIISSTWFGTNSKEIIVTALEHPPTWLAIIMAACSERTYKNSIIAKIIERGSNKDAGKQYMHSILNLLSNYQPRSTIK